MAEELSPGVGGVTEDEPCRFCTHAHGSSGHVNKAETTTVAGQHASGRIGIEPHKRGFLFRAGRGGSIVVDDTLHGR
jgi:hypothetical protein